MRRITFIKDGRLLDEVKNLAAGDKIEVTRYPEDVAMHPQAEGLAIFMYLESAGFRANYEGYGEKFLLAKDCLKAEYFSVARP